MWKLNQYRVAFSAGGQEFEKATLIMGPEQWVALVGGGAGFLSLLLTLIFWLFPSKVGAGDRFMGWLCTKGPLWPFARVKHARALGRLIEPETRDSFGELEERADAAWELFALLAPVRQRHNRWFMQGYEDADGVIHPYNHRFVEFRIAWCLFWRGESYGKFQNRLRHSKRIRR